MKEEFTTTMHADMLGWSQNDATLIDIWVEIRKGVKKSESCKKHGISVSDYETNIEKALERCL